MRRSGGAFAAGVGENKIAGAIATFVTGFVLPPDDGEGVEDVGGFLVIEAIEVEVEGSEGLSGMSRLFVQQAPGGVEGQDFVEVVVGEELMVIVGASERERRLDRRLSG